MIRRFIQALIRRTNLRTLVPRWLVTQQQLLKDIWGPSHGEDSHYLRVVVGHLRQKLGDEPARPRFIVTEAGVGYRLRDGA